MNSPPRKSSTADCADASSAEEFVRLGLTALDAYALDGYSALPSANPLRMVLPVGSNNQYLGSNASITAAFAKALETSGTEVEVVEVPGANHDDVVDLDTDASQATLHVVGDIVDDKPWTSADTDAYLTVGFSRGSKIENHVTLGGSVSL